MQTEDKLGKDFYALWQLGGEKWLQVKLERYVLILYCN